MSYNAAAGLSYAQFLLRRGNAERAETLLADVAEAAPNNVPALALLADLKLRKQDWQGAQVLAEAIKKAAGNSEISDQLTAASLAGQNRLDQSIEVLLNAKAAAPNLAQTKFALVRAYLKAGRAQEADQFLETVLSGDPSNVEALVLKGAVQVSLNKMDAAQENFEAAIVKDGKKTIGYRALADLYIKKNELEKAIETINAGLAAVPGNQDLKFALASVQEQQNKFDDAISTYRELLEINPGSMLAANNYASLVSDHHSDDPAALEKAASAAAILRGSPVPQFKDTLGWILHLRGDDKEARSLLEASTAQLPEQSLTNYHLGVVYLATGELDKAAEKLDLALKHAVNDNERSVATKALADLQAAKAKQP